MSDPEEEAKHFAELLATHLGHDGVEHLTKMFDRVLLFYLAKELLDESQLEEIVQSWQATMLHVMDQRIAKHRDMSNTMLGQILGPVIGVPTGEDVTDNATATLKAAVARIREQLDLDDGDCS